MATAYDIQLDSVGDLPDVGALLTGAELVAQRIQIRLLTWLGEWPLDKAEGKVLAYCRSGTRSTLLWALARASRGDHPAVLSEQAADAGYDLSPVTAMMDMVRGRAS